MVTQPGQFSDQEKINQALALLKNSEMPVFVHVHLLGTHGPRFSPHQQVFSTGEEQNEDWMIDYYDDAILNFDAYIEEVYNDLLASGELDNTIIVIYTDHGMAWNAKTRIPLLIYLPDQKTARKIKTNVQNMDIAPTILEYLGIPKPSWMMGISFLHSDPPASRLVVNMNRSTLISVIQYDNWYDFHINEKVWTTAKIDEPLHLYSQSEATHMEIPREIQEYLVHRGIAWQEMTFSTVAINLGGKAIQRSLLAMALLQSKNGYNYFPPEATGIFSDVSISDFYAPWIEQAYLTGMIEPCAKSPLLLFCPQQPVNRAEISMILLKAIEGKNYSPPPAKGIFDDVPVDYPFAPWIEEIYRRGITSGCSQRPRKFCPEMNVTGSQLDTFLISAFSR
jgi:hypothetical protein